MNRESHVRQSLPSWLLLPGIDEILIVDWSTRDCLRDLLELDQRIRIIRAENETRWILSCAYNLGIREARGDVILKCDADCSPKPEVLYLVPTAGQYYAGNWKSGERDGKACVNGQCLFTRAQWEQVNGYSELLRRYGYDDTDFYARLEQVGHQRHEIPASLLNFVAHTNADRVANHVAPPARQTLDAFLHSHIGFHEFINIVIVRFMPWGRWFPQASFELLGDEGRWRRVQRDASREIPISPALQEFAEEQAIKAMARHLCKIPPNLLEQMDKKTCLTQLARLARPAA